MPSCYDTFNDRCSLLNCLMGFNGPVDPFPIGYERDEIETIALSGNYEWCTSILDKGVSAGIIENYRDLDGDGDNPGPPDFDENPATTPDTKQAISFLPVSVFLWLLNTST